MPAARHRNHRRRQHAARCTDKTGGALAGRHADGGATVNVVTLLPIAPFAFAFAMQVLLTVAMTRWGAWVARRHGDRQFWRGLRWLPLTSSVLVSVGFGLCAHQLRHAFVDVKEPDPSRRAALLARGIGEAMNSGAPLLAAGCGCLLFALAAFAVGSLRAPLTRRDS